MKKDMKLWQLVGFAFTSIAGTLLHFLYEWTGENKLAALFSGVNESTWEHMKLLFFPMFAFACVEYFFFKDDKEFWCVKLRGIVSGLILIPTLFYTYNGVIGRSPDFINILIFFVSAAAAYYYETRLFEKDGRKCRSSKLSLFTLCLIALTFFLFTFYPPTIGLFAEPEFIAN